jgi:hypothetical protein
MNRLLFSCVAICIATSATAADFATRVAAAKSAGQSQEGKVVLQSLGSAYAAAMRACMSPGVNSRDNPEKFEVVAELASDGRIHNAEFRPQTRMSRCFAREFAVQSLTPPPKLRTSSGYPIYIEVEIAP